MQTIIIKKSDFNINDQYSIDNFNIKLQNINEPFEVKFDYLITEIPPWLFCYANLAKITLPASIIRINSYAFYNCKSLTKITLPNSIKSIKTNIFHNCPSLQQITIQMSKKDFLSNVENAEEFLDKHESIIFFEEKSIDTLLLRNDSIESIINNIDQER